MLERILYVNFIFILAIAMSSTSACALAKLRSIDGASNAYAQALVVKNINRFIFISRQISGQ
jgi:hypothetical protein